jgi:hypothetical protein
VPSQAINTANRPALALYRRRGFLPVGQRQIAPGVTITLLKRKTGVPAKRSPIHRAALD